MRDRRGDERDTQARRMATLVDRARKELTEDGGAQAASAHRSWREGEGYEDVPGFRLDGWLMRPASTHPRGSSRIRITRKHRSHVASVFAASSSCSNSHRRIACSDGSSGVVMTVPRRKWSTWFRQEWVVAGRALS